MRSLFFSLIVAVSLVGCKSQPKDNTPVDRTSNSADFPTLNIDDGRAMPAYKPYWEQK